MVALVLGFNPSAFVDFNFYGIDKTNIETKVLSMNQEELRNKIIESVQKLEGTFADVAFNLASVLAEQEMYRPNQLMPKTAFLERYQKQIAEELEGPQNRLKNGMVALLSAMSESEVGCDDAEIMDDLAKISNLVVLIADDRQRFIDELIDDKTIQEIAGISDGAIEKMYQASKWLYDQKRYQEARDAFGFLTMLNSQKFAFWLGLGNSEYQLQNYSAALYAYAFESRVNPTDYFCHMFACRCYEALNDLDNAKNSLELALYVIGDNPEHQEIKLTLEQHAKRIEIALRKRVL